jgi:hypothetical protein
MPLQNRVDPFGELFAVGARGTLMGNRGGKFHRDDRTLGSRRWASRQWICCVLEFNGRHRAVWGEGYSELFFLDEVTALAAGHRPCFECRRQDALAFAALYCGKAHRATAAEIDKALHAERLDSGAKQTHRRMIDSLPDGAMIALGDDAFAVRGERLLRWTPSGYGEARPRPRGTQAAVLTPPSVLTVLSRGYQPRWHPSSGRPAYASSIGGMDGSLGTPRAQAKNTIAAINSSIATTKAMQAGQPASVQAMPPKAAPKLPPT